MRWATKAAWVFGSGSGTSAGFTPRARARSEVLLEAAGVGADRGVGEIEDFGDAAVVGLDDVNPAPG
jgi:hypothetical protein